MTLSFSYQPVQLAQGTPDREGLLVFWGAALQAVLVRLSSDTHDDQGGLWFLEVGFGACAGKRSPLFNSPEAAEPWFAQQMSKVLHRAIPQAEDLKSVEGPRTSPRGIVH